MNVVLYFTVLST